MNFNLKNFCFIFKIVISATQNTFRKAVNLLLSLFPGELTKPTVGRLVARLVPPRHKTII